MTLEEQLFERFHFATFKPGQKETIASILAGQDTLAVLPTGTGKSLCYQFPSEHLNGLVVIVSPLLSLMEDQVQQLQKYGEKAVIALNSSLTYQEKEFVLSHLNLYRFLLISPEMLFQPAVRTILGRIEIGLFVVDEAHCISQWGVDFRPDYTNLHLIQQELNYPLTLALTATATAAVIKDIQQELFHDLRRSTVIQESVDRPTIGLAVRLTEDKPATLLELLPQLSGDGLIYCATRKQTETVCQLIRGQTKLKAAFYHGGLTPNERKLLQAQFVVGQLDVLCATNAFGMGINKPDIRYVIHYDLPDSLENYVQEFGRAGRDQKPSAAILLYQTGDERIHHFFHDESRSNRQLLKLLQEHPEQFETITETNELQQKWLQGFRDGNYSLAHLEKRLAQKETEKAAQLKTMLAYIHATTCLRKFIQSYFESEAPPVSKEQCCTRCGLDLSQYQRNREAKTDQIMSWETKLSKLFASKS